MGRELSTVKYRVFPPDGSDAVLTAEQLLYAFLKSIGGRAVLSEEALTGVYQKEKFIVRKVVEKPDQHYLVIATSEELLGKG